MGKADKGGKMGTTWGFGQKIPDFVQNIKFWSKNLFFCLKYQGFWAKY